MAGYILVIALLSACTDGDPAGAAREGATPEPSSTPFVAVYFYDGRALSQLYDRLPAGDPVAALMDLVAERPGPGLTTALPQGTKPRDTGEGESGLLVEMNDGFWHRDGEAVRRGAAQIVFTLAALEEGDRVTLLDGLVPGAVPGRGGGALRQPLSRADFEEFRPWVQVIHPVAGSLLGSTVPIDAAVRNGTKVEVSFADEDDASDPVTVRLGDSIPVPEGLDGNGFVTIRDRAGHEVNVPVGY